MDENSTELDEKMLKRLMAHGIIIKKDITRQQALGLIGEVILEDFIELWHEVFPKGLRDEVAKSESEIQAWVQGGS
jgi:hypothetical protein